MDVDRRYREGQKGGSSRDCWLPFSRFASRLRHGRRHSRGVLHLKARNGPSLREGSYAVQVCRGCGECAESVGNGRSRIRGVDRAAAGGGARTGRGPGAATTTVATSDGATCAAATGSIRAVLEPVQAIVDAGCTRAATRRVRDEDHARESIVRLSNQEAGSDQAEAGSASRAHAAVPLIQRVRPDVGSGFSRTSRRITEADTATV